MSPHFLRQGGREGLLALRSPLLSPGWAAPVPGSLFLVSHWGPLPAVSSGGSSSLKYPPSVPEMPPSPSSPSLLQEQLWQETTTETWLATTGWAQPGALEVEPQGRWKRDFPGSPPKGEGRSLAAPVV